eukprot:gene25469-16190_t
MEQLVLTALELDRDGDHAAADATRSELRRIAVEAGLGDRAVDDLLARAATSTSQRGEHHEGDDDDWDEEDEEEEEDEGIDAEN